ncbi:MAG: YceI family protein [Gillisia sp.]
MKTKRIQWIIDPAHSEITFKVKHLMISYVKGEFQEFDAKIETVGDDFHRAAIVAKINPASLYTNNKDRDSHLRSSDFFDIQYYNKITFKGTHFEKLDDDNYLLRGVLTIKGISKEIILDVDYGGQIQDPLGNEKAGFSFTGKINRKDWDLNWNTPIGNGGVLVSDEVRINGELQFIKQN